MQKPITIICRDFMQDISKLIQQSQLPACIIGSLLRDIEVEVNKVADVELQRDMALYSQIIDKEGVTNNDGKQNNQ